MPWTQTENRITESRIEPTSDQQQQEADKAPGRKPTLALSPSKISPSCSTASWDTAGNRRAEPVQPWISNLYLMSKTSASSLSSAGARLSPSFFSSSSISASSSFSSFFTLPKKVDGLFTNFFVSPVTHASASSALRGLGAQSQLQRCAYICSTDSPPG